VQEARSAEEKSEADFQRWKSEFARISDLAASKTVTQKLADETQQQLRAAESAKSSTAAKIQSAMSKATEAKVSVEKSKADADSVRARLAVAEAELRSAQVMVDYLTLRAPFTGVISERNVDPGRLVQSAKGATDPPLFTVIQAETVRLFIEVPEAEAVLVEPGRHAAIRVSASGGTSITGTVTRTGWSLASSNRTLRTEIDIPNSAGLLRPGMFAQVELTVAERENAIVVPKGAVISLDGQTCCLAVGAEGELQKRPVVTGLKNPVEIEIVSGLTEKDEILVANVAAFKPGQKVARSTAK
jgi:RND family efflux transporter MFP subunit